MEFYLSLLQESHLDELLGRQLQIGHLGASVLSHSEERPQQRIFDVVRDGIDLHLLLAHDVKGLVCIRVI